MIKASTFLGWKINFSAKVASKISISPQIRSSDSPINALSTLIIQIRFKKFVTVTIRFSWNISKVQVYLYPFLSKHFLPKYGYLKSLSVESNHTLFWLHVFSLAPARHKYQGQSLLAPYVPSCSLVSLSAQKMLVIRLHEILNLVAALRTVDREVKWWEEVSGQ